jgi:hypothetical protein
MPSLPLQFLLLTVAGWMTRDQRLVTEYIGGMLNFYYRTAA